MFRNKRAVKNKHAQVTIYIIIGVIILILIFGVLYVNSVLKKKGIFISPKLDPAVQYVGECLNSVAGDGLKKLGSQGGHIYLDRFDTAIAQITPFNSDVLAVDKYLSVPYWYYQKRGGNDMSEMPRLDKSYAGDYSIQDQLERYVVERLPLCLADFKALKDVGVEVKPADTGIMEANVVFTEHDTLVTLKYPLEVTSGNEQSKIDVFSEELSVNMRNIYSLARDITEYEERTTFLERNAMNWISAYSRRDSGYLPPTFGGTLLDDCSRVVFWLSSDVEKNFREMLSLNVPYLKVWNSDYEKIVINDPKYTAEEKDTVQGIFNLMANKVSDRSYPFIKVLFAYYYSFPLEVSVGRMGIIKPPVNVGFNTLLAGSKCLTTYKFAYDFKYPVMVTLLDSQSQIDNMPYLFQFPLMAVVKENLPRLRLSEVLALEEAVDLEKYSCAEAQKQSGESMITVIDKKTSAKIDSALVYFQCGPSTVPEFDAEGSLIKLTPFAERCYIGKTENGELTTKMPLCIGGGIISAVKEDYVDEAVIVGDVTQGTRLSTVLQLSPLHSFNVDVKKYFVAPPAGVIALNPGIVLDADGNVVECNVYTAKRPLESNEEAMIMIKRIDPMLIPVETAKVLQFKPGEESAEQNKIKLAPGSYEVEIYLVRNQKFKGEQDIKKNSQSLTAGGKTVYYPDKDVEIPSAFTGGSKFMFVLDEDDLEMDEILFSVFDEGKPQKIEQIGAGLSHAEPCSLLNPNLVTPIIR